MSNDKGNGNMSNERTGKVSIIVPVYNGEKTIEQTLTRILQSTYRVLEIVVVDDGSTDGSIQLCKELQKNDSRIVIYQKDNGGVATARNYGVERATGDYLCFCDQDDFVEKETYARMVERIEADASDICMCGTGRSVNGKKSLFEVSEDACYSGDEVREQLLYPMLFKGYNVPVKMGTKSRYPSIWCCMFRKSFWDTYQFLFRIYVNFEDDLLMKIDTLSRAERVSTISYTGYYWNVNLKSETYAHKFVEDLARKQQLCYEDMENCINRCTSDAKTKKLFKQVTLCKQYLDAIHILTSPYKKKSMAYIRRFCEETIYQRDFEEAITARKNVAKGQVKATILLPMLASRMSVVSYLVEKALDYILLVSLHSQLLTKLERKIKGK